MTFNPPGLGQNAGNNSSFAYINNTLYIAIFTSSGLQICSSSDYGNTFSLVATLPINTVGFVPSVCADGTLLQIIGATYSGNIATSLLLYSFDTANNTFSSPTVLATGTPIGDYDIQPISGGLMVVYSSFVSPVSSLNAIPIMSGVVGSTTVIASSNTLTYQSVSMVSGSTLELYYDYYPQAHSLTKVTTIAMRTYNGSWGVETVLSSFSCTYTDSKLTVTNSGSNRYLAEGYFTQDNFSLGGWMYLGFYDGASWTWRAQSGRQPVWCVGPDGVRLAYISGVDSGPIVCEIASLPLWNFTSDPQFKFSTSSTWLRGVDSTPMSAYYNLLASGSQIEFLSGFNIPPMAVVSPSSSTLTRGAPLALSASSSVDPNGDSITYTWASDDPNIVLTPNGASCTVSIPTSVGPNARTSHLTVTTLDSHTFRGAWAAGSYNALDVVTFNGSTYSTASSTSNAPPASPWILVAPVQATCTLNVPAVAAPIITGSSISAPRNSTVTVNATVQVGAPSTYTWTQTRGTTVEVISSTDTSITIKTNGASMLGEILGFTLTVDDGINSPVSQTFAVTVAAYPVTVEPRLLYYSKWPNTISSRNSPASWPALIGSAIPSMMGNYKAFPGLDGARRFMIVSQQSVTVIAQNQGPLLSYRRFFPPDLSQCLDAVHTEFDYSIVLTPTNLFKFGFNPVPSTDNPEATISMASWTAVSVSHLVCTQNFNNVRVIVLYGEGGAILFQVTDDGFGVQEVVEITKQSGLLSGSNAVNWVRMSAVESARSGRLFIGTTDGTSYYETLVDLASKTIVGTWNRSNVKNSIVDTGEFLQAVSEYTGNLSTPVMSTPTVTDRGVLVEWTVDRPDLVSAYILQQATNGGAFVFRQYIPSGMVQQAILSGLNTGVSYQFRVQSLNAQQQSTWSQPVAIVY